MWRRTAPIDFSTVTAIILDGMLTYSLIVLRAAATFFPVGIVHGIGGW
jgi:hypothetical protein